MDAQSPVIEVTDISKTIGAHRILDGLSLEVPSGAIYGISGHNGAGKSMLLRIVAGLVRHDQGSVRVFGETVGEEVEFPRDTGAIIDQPGFLPHYSGSKNLHLLAMIRNQITHDQIAETLQRVGLDPADSRPVRTYSTGMRQRLGLAQAIMEQPRLLLLDEPTSGIDRAGVAHVHDLLRTLRAQGVTILLTSHSQDEITLLCDRAYVLERGTLLT